MFVRGGHKLRMFMSSFCLDTKATEKIKAGKSPITISVGLLCVRFPTHEPAVCLYSYGATGESFTRCATPGNPKAGISGRVARQSIKK